MTKLLIFQFHLPLIPEELTMILKKLEILTHPSILIAIFESQLSFSNFIEHQ